MIQQIPLDDSDRADEPTDDAARDDGTREVASDVAYKRLLLVNVVFVGDVEAGDRNWVLIDTAVGGSASAIARAAADRFGPGARPAAIIQTHGHFDHAGSLQELAEQWDVPVVAHHLELPYLSGLAAYPPPDPSVGGGLMSLTSQFFPRGPYDVSKWLHPLDDDGHVPAMPGWRWLHTPGHTPGHISLWRQSDRTLIAGDAIITTAQESAYAVATQRPEMHGPPMYYTQDWDAARASVQLLASLNPELIVTGHGPAMRGENMRRALHALAENFDQVAVPQGGRYVQEPVRTGSPQAYHTE